MNRALILSLCLFAFVAEAREQHGVNLPDTASVEGQTLKLVGMGLRKKWFFDVYVAGLYLTDPAQDALSADLPRRVVLVLLRDLDSHKVSDSIREGFERNSAAELPKLNDRLAQLSHVLPDVKRGQTLSLTYLPGKGTVVKSQGQELTTIPGKDFADALFAVWLGKVPADQHLKEQLLGH